MELSGAIVKSFLESNEEFPVDFEDAWKWIGYSSKQAAKKKLSNNFEEGVDYLSKWIKTPSGGRSSESIKLTIDCFKSLAMMAGTEQGRNVRKYFLDCEKDLKKAVQIISGQSDEIRILELQLELHRLTAHTEQIKRDRETSYFAVLATMGETAGKRIMAEARGEVPIQLEKPEPEIKFIEQGTDRVIGSTASDRTLTRLLKDAGLNPKSKKDSDKAKAALKAVGLDYASGEGLERALYLRDHYVIPAEKYEEARDILTKDCAAANIFVWGLQQLSLSGSKQQAVLGG